MNIFTNFKKKYKTRLTAKAAEASLLEEMQHVSPASDEYRVMAENLRTLREAQSKIRAHLIDPSILLAILGNISILLLYKGIETSGTPCNKVMSFISKILPKGRA